MLKILIITGVFLTHLLAWTFNQEDYDNLTEAQRTIIKDSYNIGAIYNLGYTLAAISIVETRAGAIKDSSDNRICGPHQVDVRISLRYLKSKSDYKKLCKALESHSILSSHLALLNLRYWSKNSKSYKQMIKRYNRGWNKSKYDKEYLRRFEQVLKVLHSNKLSF